MMDLEQAVSAAGPLRPAPVRPEWPAVCVGIATRGRPAVLASILPFLRAQSLAPLRIIVSCTAPADVQGLPPADDLEIIVGPPGSSTQRNAILDKLPDDTAVVAFFDDDFVPHRDWLRSACRVLRDEPAVACVTGHVLADGIKGPGLTLEQARHILAQPVERAGDDWAIEGYSPYGCNMAFRRSAIASIRFDERLVLYGWLEDRDFGATVALRGGRLVKIGKARGVHLGVKGGRVSGRRFGYSQVMNPAYMYMKGTLSAGGVADHIARNLTANLLRSCAPEKHIDRAGRLFGNGFALLDLLRGRVTPERAASL